jgi:hypothetical protein
VKSSQPTVPLWSRHSNCLEENDAVLPGQFPDALGVYMEIMKSKKGDVSDMTLAVLPRHSDGYTGLVVPERKKSNGAPWFTGSQRKLAGGRDFTIRP